ncbi:substrate-binding domain-containing protein [Ectopseudomonas chengduensis]|nr:MULTISPECIES: substrate-binding domain-containing protein [Pseudomonas]MDZ4190973.1 substrate-binding domain-containing protein [Pseudomonas sp.]UZT80844.1 substrate-binding domain-containing protein [Pseudomonas chengduensis]
MFKRNVLAVSMAVAGLCSAQAMAAVVGGGATLPENLYGIPGTTGILNGSAPYAGFNDYIGVGSGGGKSSFFNNNSNLLVWDLDGNGTLEPVYSPAVTVDYAGSDSIVSMAELNAYNAPGATHGRDNYGPLVQIPSAATSVTVPFNVTGLGSLDLTSQQLADIFAGTITDWSDLNLGQGIAGPITVVYRQGSSGTSEIFLRHLNAVAPGTVTGVSSTFTSVITPGANFVSAVGSSGVAAAVAATAGSIGYVGPEAAEFNNPAKVVRVKRSSADATGLLPSQVNVTAALNSVSLPVGGATAASDPLAWAPAAQLANPSAGYPIVGVTNLIFSQCYLDTAAGGDLAKIRSFLARHYNANPASNNDSDISASSLIPLPGAWKTAVRNNFITNQTNNGLDIGNLNVCNGKGRPL